MPNRKNAIIQLRKDAKRTTRNTGVRSELKTERKKFEKVLVEGNKENVQQGLKKLVSVIDKTVKKGVIPKGRGSRLKSKYALKANAIA